MARMGHKGKLLKEMRRAHSHLNWLIPVKASEWRLVSRDMSYSAPPGHRATARIASGDNLIFYVVKKERDELAGSIVGVFQAVSEWYNPNNTKEQNQGVSPMMIKLKVVNYGLVEYRHLSNRLRFVEDKQHYTSYLQGTPANSNRPVPEEDLKLIVRKMEQGI